MGRDIGTAFGAALDESLWMLGTHALPIGLALGVALIVGWSLYMRCGRAKAPKP